MHEIFKKNNKMINSKKLERKKQEARYSNIKNALWLLSQSASNGKLKLSYAEKVSFNTIVKFYENNKKENLRNNELFAKMFIFVYSHTLKHYKASVFDTIPQKTLYSLLDKPISYHIEKFTEQLNDSEIYSYVDEKNLSFNRLSEEELKDIDVNKLIQKPFDSETVGDQLNSMMNNYINHYNK